MDNGVRIVISGGSSVGKTTLALDWCGKHGDHFQYIPEVARNVMREYSYSITDVKESLKTEEKKEFLRLQQLIIEEQNRKELSIITTDVNSSFISDRGPEPMVFALYYAGPDACDQLELNPAAQACLERYKKSLVVVLCPLNKVTEDGVRLTLDVTGLQDFTRMLCRYLDKRSIPYVYIDKTDRLERLHALEEAVKHFKRKQFDNL